MTDRIEELVRKTKEALVASRLPESTYRLQFHAGFTFRDAAAIVPYLHDLGITDCYASPYLQARPGSQHGYDIVNHQALNPEVGSESDHAEWCTLLARHQMGQILDMVPNHMGVATNDNSWWNDVLENGPASRYASFFDIAWHSSPRPELQNKVLLPVLGDLYGKVLESGQLRLVHEPGTFVVSYFDRRFPISPRSVENVLDHRLDELKKRLGEEADPLLEYQSILTAIRHLPDALETDPARLAERQREKEIIKKRLATLISDNPKVGEFIDENVTLFNGKPGEPASFDLLDRLLDRQNYRLSYWRVASDEINYRRFFDVNDLAALSMEREDVFEATHTLVFRLLQEGRIHGLRIDHPDGLYDPRQYLMRLQLHRALDCARNLVEKDPTFSGMDWKDVEAPLRERLEQERSLYVVVEKILGSGEQIPADWPTWGTSGYEFLNVVNGLFVDGSQERAWTRLYMDQTGEDTSFADLVYHKKSLILRVSLSSELQMLAHQLDRLAQKNRWTRDFTLHTLRDALRATIAAFPVYRSYITAEGVSETDRRYILMAIRQARYRNPTLSIAVFHFIRDMLLLRQPESASELERAEQVRFAGKFQQVTAPVMAKGVEDTAFYIYNRLVSLNEVGGDPALFGHTVEEVHRFFKERQSRFPYALSPLSTHDTKRSEDVRARLNVLSELPRQWGECLERWGRLNERLRVKLEGEEVTVPDRNEEYLLYQTLIGAWPLERASDKEHAELIQRIQEYMLKALHEAKVHTSWINPDPTYDEAISQFVAGILDREKNSEFVQEVEEFARVISHHGMLGSLSQTVIRLTAPGAPDTYQGTELWDFSLVDPDNRRPVDYGRRQRLLGELQKRVGECGNDRGDLVEELLKTSRDGRIKLYVTWQALHQRRDHPGLFSRGEYLPLEVAGAKAEHVFAFARREGDRVAVVAVPRLLTRLVPMPTLPLGSEVWQDTKILLPDLSAERLENVFTKESVRIERRDGLAWVWAAEVFKRFPVAILR